MAHQCLECGAVYEEGSPELLEGCADCGGTRFFFTQEPLEEDERQDLQDQATDDLKAIVEDMLDEGVKPDYEDDLWSHSTRREWLALDPETAGQTVKEYVQEMADDQTEAAPEPDAAPETPDAADAPDPDVVDELEGLVEDTRGGTVMESLDIDVITDDEAGDDVVEVDPFVEPEIPAAEAVESEAGDDAAPEPADVPTPPEAEPDPVPEELWEAEEPEDEGEEDGRPEVVTVTEPGSYEIDVERMMGGSPIIVQKEGRYLVHLPSLFRDDPG